MTVCVAAIARNGAIIGAADRMVTGFNEREPRRSKIYHFNDLPITFMYAGTIPLASAVLRHAAAVVTGMPRDKATVENAAHAVASVVKSYFGLEGEKRFVIPLQHTVARLMAPDSPVDAALRDSLIAKVQNYKPPKAMLCVLVVGYDPDGTPSLWQVVNTDAQSKDIEGYAAIGWGFSLADETFQVQKFSRMHTTPERTILTTFVAKRRAEAAPSVGRAINMFFREPTTRKWARVQAAKIRELDKLHGAMRRAESAAWTTAVRGAYRLFVPSARSRPRASKRGSSPRLPSQG